MAWFCRSNIYLKNEGRAFIPLFTKKIYAFSVKEKVRQCKRMGLAFFGKVCIIR